eukprot:TRINITY_DN7428_c0_g1_i1.p1 TRINITY_DN7428_c0_g1~~TRINITY_DN7428_c0_g1_i1.p1  ORF type:complete len:172 (+),score=22.64 TRINITY_DN7428_c0_g1_i1:60-518(+)
MEALSLKRSQTVDAHPGYGDTVETTTIERKTSTGSGRSRRDDHVSSSPEPPVTKQQSMSKIVLSVAVEDDTVKDAVCYGYVLVGTIFFGIWLPLMYAAFVSKIVTFRLPTGHPVLDFIADDEYYSFLVPLTIPVALVVVYLNWFGLKLFRHS